MSSTSVEVGSLRSPFTSQCPSSVLGDVMPVARHGAVHQFQQAQLDERSDGGIRDPRGGPGIRVASTSTSRPESFSNRTFDRTDELVFHGGHGVSPQAPHDEEGGAGGTVLSGLPVADDVGHDIQEFGKLSLGESQLPAEFLDVIRGEGMFPRSSSHFPVAESACAEHDISSCQTVTGDHEDVPTVAPALPYDAALRSLISWTDHFDLTIPPEPPAGDVLDEVSGVGMFSLETSA